MYVPINNGATTTDGALQYIIFIKEHYVHLFYRLKYFIFYTYISKYFDYLRNM